MKLETRKYKTIDVLKMPLKAAPVAVTLLMLWGIMQAIIPTALLAVATAWFVDTAIAIFADKAVTSAIYAPLALLLVVVALNSLITNAGPQIITPRIKFALERKFIPAFIDVRASLSYKHIESAKSWELVERVSKDPIKSFQDGLYAYRVMIRSILSVIAILGLIITQIWWAVPVIAVFSVPLFWVAIRAGQKNYEAKVDTRKYVRRHEYYTEVLTNREAVEERTLFGYGEKISDDFIGQYEKARKVEFWVQLKQYAMAKSASICMSLIAILIALTLINPVITGDLTPGLFMGIIAAVFGMVNMLGWSLQDATEDLAQSKEYMGDLTAFVELSRTEGAKDLPDDEPIAFKELEFRNVSFKYPTAEENILNGLSLKIESGKHYAFVGANGAGKTTITKLLTGLYDEYDGEILINGKELRTYDTSALKALFSVVYQDFARYQVSLAENIALGDTARDVGDDSINKIASLVELDETITDLPNGINTPLGKVMEGGVDISGGQWQKVAIARSLISRAPIKILDEPTAALDPIAESRIYQEFEGLMKGKTSIFISHRLGSTKLADEILVIENGEIVENGSHDKLMKQDGLYAQMFEAQRKWYNE
ncbi:MAG: ABC transporter ATP-binding protein/permease [Defluviitaleaceae bacterium]|nr:ABC transporter ATP-binding protein/permease [Defluviitaleaceae bacterium]